MILSPGNPTNMDSIKKKMEKLANETAEAEARIAHFEDIKSANEAEAERYEEHVRNIQKKMQVMESSFDVCTEDLFNQTVKLEEMEKKAGNAEGEVSALRSRLILLQVRNIIFMNMVVTMMVMQGEFTITIVMAMVVMVKMMKWE